MTSLASVGIILLPNLVSSAYASVNTSINSKSINDISILNATSPQLQAASNCNYGDNLFEEASDFISRCCKGTILRRFPGQYFNKTLLEISLARRLDPQARTAYKLLNDGRFRK